MSWNLVPRDGSSLKLAKQFVKNEIFERALSKCLCRSAPAQALCDLTLPLACSDMLASQVLRAEQRPAKAAPARATRPEHRGRAALKAWRIVLDKLYCVLQWGRYQTAISAWMCFPATNLEVSPASTTTTRSGATLAATSKANFYKNYLEKNPEQLARVKGLPVKSSEECLHEARAHELGSLQPMPQHLWPGLCVSEERQSIFGNWSSAPFVVLLAAPEFSRNRRGRLPYPRVTLRMWWWR